MAQLVARLVRNEKVRSSNLLSSTTTKWPRQFRGHFSSWLSFVLLAQVGTCASSTKVRREGGSHLLLLSVDKKFVAVVPAGLLGPLRKAAPKRRASAIDADVYLAQVVDPFELARAAFERARLFEHDVHGGSDMALDPPNQLGARALAGGGIRVVTPLDPHGQLIHARRFREFEYEVRGA